MAGHWMHRRFMLSSLATAVAGALLFALWGAVHAAAPVPPRHDIIVLLDNSGSMVRTYNQKGGGGEPADKGQQRIAFTKFLVQALQLLRPTSGDSIGVALFAAPITEPFPISSTIPLVTLKPVEEWTAADIALIQQRPCVPNDVGKENQKAFKVGKDACYGTHYSPALEWAQTELTRLASCKDDAQRQCDILVFTDGAIGWEPNSDTTTTTAPEGEKLLKRTLDELHAEGIRTNILLLSGPDSRKSDQEKWQSWKEEGDVEAYPSTHRLPATDVYTDAIRMVGLTDEFMGFKEVWVPKEGAQISIEVKPRTESLKIEVLPRINANNSYYLEGSIPVTPTIQTEREHWWILPSFNQLGMKLSNPGMTYYRITPTYRGHSTPLWVSLAISPKEIVVDQKFDIVAQINDPEKMLLDMSSIQVQASIQRGETIVTTVELSPEDEDVWRGSMSGLPVGNYNLEANVKSNSGGEVQFKTIADPFVVTSRLPMTLALNVQPSRPWMGEGLYFSATAERLETLGDYDTAGPVLQIQPFGNQVQLARTANGAWRTSQPMVLPSGLYTAQLVAEHDLNRYFSDPLVFEVRPAPVLTVTTGLNAAAVGERVPVTVTVAGKEVPPPELWEYHTSSEAISVLLTPSAPNLYVGAFLMPQANSVTLIAQVPGNETDVYFQSPPQEVASESPIVWSVVLQLINFWRRFHFFIVGILALIGALLAVLLWYRRPEYRLARQLANPRRTNLVWRGMTTWTVVQNWPQIKALGNYVSNWIDDNGELTKIPSDQSASFRGFEQNLRTGVEATRAALIYALVIRCSNSGTGKGCLDILKVIYHRSLATSIYIQQGLAREIIRRYQKEHKNTSFALDIWSKAAELTDSRFESENQPSLVETLDKYMAWLNDPRIPENIEDRRLYLVLHHLYGTLKQITAHCPIDFPTPDGEYASINDFVYAATHIPSMSHILKRVADLAWPPDPSVVQMNTEEKIEQVRRAVEADIQAASDGTPHEKVEGNPMEYYMLKNLILKAWTRSPGD